MTPPSLWKTILFCLHLHGSSFFLLFCSQKSHGTFANIFKSCEKQDFFFCWFFKSSTSQVFLFKACSTMPSSSWLVLNAVGLWEGKGGGWRKKKNKVGEILLISSCRFPFLYLTMAPLFCLTHSIFVYFLSFDMGMRKL